MFVRWILFKILIMVLNFVWLFLVMRIFGVFVFCEYWRRWGVILFMEISLWF